MANHFFLSLTTEIKPMKKSLFVMVLLFIMTSCEGPYIFNRVVKLKDGNKMLLGGVDREAFSKEPFSVWFDREYNAYTTNPAMIKEFKGKLKRYRIEVFMGTWCEDSQREFPRMMKILDEAKFPKQRLLTYAVNESKKSFYSEEIGKDIRFVPTFIFYKGGKEIGRIVEAPVSGSLEEDIMMIVNETPLTPNYSED